MILYLVKQEEDLNLLIMFSCLINLYHAINVQHCIYRFWYWCTWQ